MKVAIIGGGACGVICALKLKKNNPNINVTILEQNDRILKKVLKTSFLRLMKEPILLLKSKDVEKQQQYIDVVSELLDIKENS